MTQSIEHNVSIVGPLLEAIADELEKEAARQNEGGATGSPSALLAVAKGLRRADPQDIVRKVIATRDAADRPCMNGQLRIYADRTVCPCGLEWTDDDTVTCRLDKIPKDVANC
jgi:hypothetical protein